MHIGNLMKYVSPVRASEARNGMVRYSMVLGVHRVHDMVRNGDKMECARRVNRTVRNKNGNFFVTATVCIIQ